MKVLIFLQILLYAGAIFFFIRGMNKWENYANRMKENIGKTVIISKDTLTITDYSTINQCYYLSNGSNIGDDFIDKLLKK